MGSIADLFVPLLASTDLTGTAPLDLTRGVRVVAIDPAGVGVAAAIQADLDRVLPSGAPVPGAAELRLEVRQDLDVEAYSLHVDETGAGIAGSGAPGLARGAATFRQLIDASGETAMAAEVRDQPRFAWRGLLVDCVRHYLPLAALHRTIDAMALAKLNVLHLHLTDDQAWRVESRAYPELTSVAAPDGHYTLPELAALVSYAADRGVRIVPELDVPGHTSALLVARPDLALGVPPDSLPTSYVVPGVSVDPHAEAVYEVLGTILGEWAEVFPDPFVHIGGDEAPVLGAERQAGFTARMVELVEALGRTAIVWDEALHPDLPTSVVVQAWRSPAKLFEAVRAGHRALLSSGWYLDLGVPLRFLHAVDPGAPPTELEAAVLAPWNDRGFAGTVGGLAAAVVRDAGSLDGVAPLGEAEERRVLGGEACLWSERVTPELLDTYLWPSAAAVGDRLWSGRAALDDLAPRLVESRFDLLPDLRRWTSVRPANGPRRILGALAALEGTTVGERPSARDVELALATLADWCEPVRWYARATAGWPEANGRSTEVPVPGTTQPLDRFVDALVPECAGHRTWRLRTAAAQPNPDGSSPFVGEAHAVLAQWRFPASVLRAWSDGSYRTDEPRALADRLVEAADLLSDLLAELPAQTAVLRDVDAAVDLLHEPVGDATIAVRAVFEVVRTLGAG